MKNLIVTMVLILTALYSLTALGKPKSILLTAKNSVILNGEINPATFDTFLFALIAKRNFLPPSQTLYVIIASPGGEVDVAKAIAKALDAVPNLALICRDCASAAAWIFEATKHSRYITSTSVLMTHQVHREIRPLDNLNGVMENLRREGEEFNSIFQKRMRLSKQAYESRIINGDWNMNADEIMSWHLADEEVAIDCDYYVKAIAPITCGER